MKTINGTPKTLKELLQNTKYIIHYYQREYMWQRKQIEEMIDDLTAEFLNNYQEGDTRPSVQGYGTYFMGSVVLAGEEQAIIDGQQRLSSLTLLLIYLLQRLRKLGLQHNTMEQMIYSEEYGVKSFNIDVEDRRECMRAIFDGKDFDPANASESAVNLYARYQDIAEEFPEEITDAMLLNFCDWIINKVIFIRIEARTEQDAYRVFILMNDRGLRLTSVEMLKGYLLSEVKDDRRREQLNQKWKETTLDLKKNDDNGDETFIKNWLRAQYAENIREGRAGSIPLDFDNIGTAFHKWVRDERLKIGLRNSADYDHFIEELFRFADIYQRIRLAENHFTPGLEYIYYNKQVDFSLQTQLLMAPICEGDDASVQDEKLNLTARFIDLLIVSRVTRSRSVEYSGIKNYVFRVTKDIRRTSVPELKMKLLNWYWAEDYHPETAIPNWSLYQFTKRYVKNLLARVCGYIEDETMTGSKYSEYMEWRTRNPYEIEHITTDHYEWFTDEYHDKSDFDSWRNNIGDLLLLRKSINASLNDSLYADKLTTYSSSDGNIYSASLDERTYQHNPRFLQFIREHDLPFQAYTRFGKEEIRERRELLAKLVKLVWNDELFIE